MREMETLSSSPAYLHGYGSGEHARLLHQGRSLEPHLYPFIRLEDRRNLLEVGCGVGAQTEIILRRFPEIRITAVDHEPSQIVKAKQLFAGHPGEDRVRWEMVDALRLPYPDGAFDCAFICWVLEHATKPLGVLNEVFRVLERGGILYTTEVLNAPILTHPECSAITEYWRAYNELQKSLRGDPHIGARLPNMLIECGFDEIETHTVTYHIDRRMSAPERREAFRYWERLFLTAAPGLTGASLISNAQIKRMVAEFKALRQNPDSVFFLVAMQARGRK